VDLPVGFTPNNPIKKNAQTHLVTGQYKNCPKFAHRTFAAEKGVVHKKNCCVQHFFGTPIKNLQNHLEKTLRKKHSPKISIPLSGPPGVRQNLFLESPSACKGVQ
jgi:hypothetical protein